MNTNPMTDQVNRLIGNRLAAGCDLFLPGIGSLYVEQIGARRLSKRLVEPPCRVVTFTSQERGASLVDEIVVAANCEQEKAQSIYDRWLDSVLGDNTLIIDGVGAIQFNNFIPEPEFEELLNPQGRTPVKVGAGASGWLLWGCIATVVLLLGVGYFIYRGYRADRAAVEDVWDDNYDEVSDFDTSDDDEPETAAAPEKNAPEKPAASRPAVEKPAAPGPAAPTPAPAARPLGSVEAPAPAARPLGSVEAPASLVAGRHYVVAGVFGQPENAANNVARFKSEDPAVQVAVYRYGNDRLMVSLFASDRLEACQDFIRANRYRWPDCWTYSAR